MDKKSNKDYIISFAGMPDTDYKDFKAHQKKTREKLILGVPIFLLTL